LASIKLAKSLLSGAFSLPIGGASPTTCSNSSFISALTNVRRERFPRRLGPFDEEVSCGLLDDLVYLSLLRDLLVRSKSVVNILQDVLRIAHKMSAPCIAEANDAALGTIVE